MPRFAANLSFLFPDLPFIERFAAAAACGFKAVEYLFPYDHPPERISELLRYNGLEQALFNMPPGDWEKGERGIAALPGREREFAKGVELALDYARALGCRRVHAMAGILPPDVSREAAERTFLANLRHAVEQAAPHNITVQIEPINDRVDMPGYFLTRTDQAMALIDQVPGLMLQYDIYHQQIMAGDLTATLRRHFASISHIQIAGVPGRNEPDTGEIAYGFLFAELDSLGYEGWVGCEYRPRRGSESGGTRAGLGWARDHGIG
jgi:hydroxypyruvate isomerase